MPAYLYHFALKLMQMPKFRHIKTQITQQMPKFRQGIFFVYLLDYSGMLYFWALQLQRKWIQYTIPINCMWTWLNTSDKFWVVQIFTDKATSISVQFLGSWPICKQPYPYFWEQDHVHKSKWTNLQTALPLFLGTGPYTYIHTFKLSTEVTC